MWDSMNLPTLVVVKGWLASISTSTRFHVDHVSRDGCAFQIIGGYFHLLDLGLLQFLIDTGRDLAALRDYRNPRP